MKTRLYFNTWVVMVMTALLSLFFARPVSAEIQVGEYEGWKVGVSGSLSAFAVSTQWDDCDTCTAVGGFPGTPESTFRIQSGYFPAQLFFHIRAPEVEGVDVSAHFGTAAMVQGNKSRTGGNGIQYRVADLQFAGSYGTFAIGRNWSIFNTQSLVHDTGSWYGVGRILSPDQSAPGWGHIGTGYTWTDFTPRAAYTTPTFAGLTFNIGLFDPLEQGADFDEEFHADVKSFDTGGGTTGDGLNLETPTPRIEAELAYTNAFGPLALDAWAGFMQQTVEIAEAAIADREEDGATAPEETSVDITGFDAGLELRAFGVALTGSVTQTEGTNTLGLIGAGFSCSFAAADNVAAGCFAETWNQMFVEVDYAFSDFTVGVNYGQGVRDETEANEGGYTEQTNTLTMAFVHYQFRPYMRWVLEFHQFEGTDYIDADNNVGTDRTEETVEDYSAIAIGTTLFF